MNSANSPGVQISSIKADFSFPLVELAYVHDNLSILVAKE
jgi:hypothetical protein